MSQSWRDALMRLHVAGWDTDDIDGACEALAEACEERGDDPAEVTGLTVAEVRDILEIEIGDDEVPALLTLTALHSTQGAEAGELRKALYDLDAFAYSYAGDD
jgi:hypothetical protein